MGKKLAEKLGTAETLYESRMFEALHRIKRSLKIRRQVAVTCRGCRGADHDVGKQWIIDFYVWPRIVVEIDGHAVRADRDLCLSSRGLFILHFSNDEVREMSSAIKVAGRVEASQFITSTLREILRAAPAGVEQEWVRRLLVGGALLGQLVMAGRWDKVDIAALEHLVERELRGNVEATG